MNRSRRWLVVAGAAMVCSAALAQGRPADRPAPGTAGAAAAAIERTEGEVRRIDDAARKITIRHGEIRSLGMTPMTMAFVVGDRAMPAGLKVGQRIRFTAKDVGGTLTAVDIEALK